ncbi:sigma-70 family RNA polymerase sigma factor [Planococcus soli]|uniref:sigma-70 family RNA polymerase sigma factor n=1 Tax=Planococcus soli TaxID=2666072 RepID=UPI00115E83CE|nr:sigma-70 family RNA polymerase sigma factor [Planococcus soli]
MTSLTDLYKQAQKGDSSAFEAWAKGILANTGRFGYQVGVPIEELPALQQRTAEQLYSQLIQFTPEEAEIQFYKRIIQQSFTMDFPVIGKGNPQVLGFLEDQELHNELQQLELQQRITLALFYFQELSLEDILAITEKSEQQLEELQREGLRKLQSHLQLGERQTVQRLAMLQKSYQRLMLPSLVKFEEQRIEAKLPVAESALLKQKPTPIKKKTGFLLGAAGLFLASVIGVSFSVNDQQQQNAGTTGFQQENTVTDGMVDDWQNQYETIKETSPDRLGMTKEQYEQLKYVKLADAEKERVFSRETLETLEKDPIGMEERVDRLFRQIETPRGMVDSLSGSNPMLSTEMENFLRNFEAKTDELRVYADSVLTKYGKELESTIVMEQLSPEKLMAQTESFPEELRLVVEALPEYSLMAVVHPNEERLRTVRDVSKLNQQQPMASDPYAWGYLSFLSTEPYFDSSGFLMPLDLVPQHLITMEQALLEEGGATSLFDGVEVAYLQTFWQLLKGGGNSPVFDKEGKVKIEYRSAWSGVASSNPMAYVMLPILEEMEASGWTASAHYDDVQFDDLLNALEMEKSGILADKLPNGDLVIEDEFVDLKDFDYSRIEPLYESFTAAYDTQILSGVPPLDVLFMYHYANSIDDTETIWHLLADSPIKPTLQAFQEEWQPIPELTENANWVELSEDFYKQRVKDKVYLYPQIDSEEFLEQLDVLLVTEKDQIWQINYQRYASRNLLEDEQFQEQVDSLYTLIAGRFQNQLPVETDAVEVAGVFFKAADAKDIEVMGKLMAETDWTNEELRYFLDISSFQPFSELEELTFRTHFNPEMLTYGSGSVDLKYASDSKMGMIQVMFDMKETAAGWRMAGMKNF